MSDFLSSPEIRQYSHLELIARQVVEGFITGLHKSPFHGFSVEFAEHRLYNTGESTRHIDWKLYARTEKLFIKNFEEETNLRCQIVIDNSHSMYYPEKKGDLNKLGFSVYSAAAIIELMKKQRDAVGLSLFSGEVSKHYTARSGQVHRKVMMRELENLLETEKQNIPNQSFVAGCLHDIAERIHKRSLLLIFSDMIDHSEKKEEIFSALRHLKHNKHEIILFHVHDADTELNFEFENRPYRFVDLESKEELKVNPLEIKELYRKKASEYFNQIKLECGHFGIDFVVADVKAGFHQVLYPYLVKRTLMP